MSIDEVSQTRKIKGFKVTVTKEGPMGLIASKSIAQDVGAFLDKIERALEKN